MHSDILQACKAKGICKRDKIATVAFASRLEFKAAARQALLDGRTRQPTPALDGPG